MEAVGPLGVTAKSPKQETTTQNVRQAGVQTGHCRGTWVDGEKLDLGVMVSVGVADHIALPDDMLKHLDVILFLRI